MLTLQSDVDHDAQDEDGHDHHEEEDGLNADEVHRYDRQADKTTFPLERTCYCSKLALAT